MADSNTQVAAVGAGGKVAVRGELPAVAADGHPATLQAIEGHPAWPMLSRLPVTMAVHIPLRGFRLCDLLKLECGQTVESAWATAEDVPLKVGALRIGWGEFEVVEQRMALRLTRLA